MSDNNSLSDEINIMIDTKINTIPTPTKCRITKIYDDNNHVDITSDLGDLEYIETIGTPIVNHTGVLLPLNGSTDEFIIITR